MFVYNSYKYLAVILAAIILSGCSVYEVKSRQYDSSGIAYSTTTTRYAFPATYYY